MTNTIAISAVLILLIPGVWWVSHTRLVAARNDVDGSWADVDAELRRRHDLIPQLIGTVEAATPDEGELLTDLAHRNDAAAAQHTAPAANQLEPPLTDAVARVVALGERYPQLNCRGNFPEIRHQLISAEDRIGAAGRFYNTRVEQLNRRVRAPISGMVARHHGFTKAELFDP